MAHTENTENILTTTTTKHDQLEYDKLTFFYMSLPYILLGQFLGAFLLSALMLNVVDIYSIGIWLLLSILVFLYRVYHYRLFKTTPESEKLLQGALWLDRYYTDVLVSGIIWGASAFLIFPASDLMSQAIVLLFLVTIGFSSMGILASKYELLLTYVLVVFIPVILRLFFMEDMIYQTIAYAGLGLVLLMILAANYYGTIINNSLSTRQDYVTTHDSYLKVKKQFFSLFENAPVAVFHFDRNLVIEEANDHFVKLIGAKNSDDIIGDSLRSVWKDSRVLELHERVLQGYKEEYRDALNAHTPDQQTTYVNLASVPMYDDDKNVTGGITIIKDITPEIQAKEELIHFMHYDTLTDLPNRELLLKRIKTATDAKLRDGVFGALLFLDIDHFNNINRSYGQSTGDNILKKISDLFQGIVGKYDTVSRIGADTFVILLPNLSEEAKASKEQTREFIASLRNAFDKALVVGEANYHIGFSIGVTLFNTNENTPLDLIKHAEMAMFDAKNGARGTVRFYKKDRDGSALDDMAIANDLYKAIKNDELEMYYQPQQDIHKGILTGAEALVRWNHPRRGPISPAHFIPIAEESGAIIKLEEWIFDHVFRDMRVMAETLNDFPLNYVAVNVSSVHFLQPNFVEKFMRLIHKHRINPLWVNIEITESGIMRNIDEAIERIHELKRLGFSFSIDDFGTGYSSLTYLKKLPVDIIKIDRSFVKDADRDEEDRLIVESVIEISRKFGFKVLAEGIDRQETLDYFKTTACKTYQGYLYYKPISMSDFVQLI